MTLHGSTLSRRSYIKNFSIFIFHEKIFIETGENNSNDYEYDDFQHETTGYAEPRSFY
jgi:hypothetical protein